MREFYEMKEMSRKMKETDDEMLYFIKENFFNLRKPIRVSKIIFAVLLVVLAISINLLPYIVYHSLLGLMNLITLVIALQLIVIAYFLVFDIDIDDYDDDDDWYDYYDYCYEHDTHDE